MAQSLGQDDLVKSSEPSEANGSEGGLEHEISMLVEGKIQTVLTGKTTCAEQLDALEKFIDANLDSIDEALVRMGIRVAAGAKP